MNSQQNEAMNKSIMRYIPKDKTYSRTMALTSRLNLAISIDSLGHAEYFERLFGAMKFRVTELTFSGLRRMWRKKEYGRMYSAKKTVKQRRRINAGQKMIEGVKKMEANVRDGMAYSSAIRLEDDDGEERDGEEPAKKKAKKTINKKKRTSSSKKKKEEGCKCGGRDHQRITSGKCPWKGLSTSEISENYERRVQKMKTDENDVSTDANDANVLLPATVTPCQDPTRHKVQSTSKYWREPEILICDMRTHDTHLVQLLR